jgi:hypothetical protein
MKVKSVRLPAVIVGFAAAARSLGNRYPSHFPRRQPAGNIFVGKFLIGAGMKLNDFRPSVLAAFAVLSACAFVAASGGRDFAGFYSLSNPTTIRDQVILTFSTRIFNYSDADVIGATVTLKGPAASKGDYATFDAITLINSQSIRLSREITVPLEEYRQWHGSRHPELLISYMDHTGVSRRQLVELSRSPVGQEN